MGLWGLKVSELSYIFELFVSLYQVGQIAQLNTCTVSTLDPQTPHPIMNSTLYFITRYVGDFLLKRSTWKITESLSWVPKITSEEEKVILKSCQSAVQTRFYRTLDRPKHQVF